MKKVILPIFMLALLVCGFNPAKSSAADEVEPAKDPFAVYATSMALEKLDSDDDAVRFQAIYLLRQLGPGARGARSQLHKIVRDVNETTDIRLAALRAAMSINKESVLVIALLKQMLSDPDPYIRAYAIENLDVTRKTARQYVDALSDEHPEVRKAAALVFTNRNIAYPMFHLREFYPEVKTTLREMLEDEVDEVRYSVAVALSELDQDSDYYFGTIVEAIEKRRLFRPAITSIWRILKRGGATGWAAPAFRKLVDESDLNPKIYRTFKALSTDKNGFRIPDIYNMVPGHSVYRNYWPRYLRDFDLISLLKEHCPTSQLYIELLRLDPDSIDLSTSYYGNAFNLIIIHRDGEPYIETNLWTWGEEGLLEWIIDTLGFAGETREVVESLVRCLESPNASIATSAVKAIARLGPIAVPALPEVIDFIREKIDIGGSSFPSMKLERCIEYVGWLGWYEPEPVLELYRELFEEGRWINSVLRGIGRMSSKAREFEPLLLEMLSGESAGRYSRLSYALLSIWYDDDDAIEKIRGIMWHEVEEVRSSIISYLYWFGPLALPLLEEYAENDPSEKLREEAKATIKWRVTELVD